MFINFNILSHQGNTNQNHFEILEQTRSIKQMTTHASEMLGKGQNHPLLIGLQTCTATVEISKAVPQEAVNRSTSRSSYNISGHIPKRLYSLEQTHSPKHVHDIQKLERA